MKLKVLTSIFTVLFLVLLGNLFRMQIIQYKHYQLRSEQNRIRPMQLEAPRGIVIDRKGREMATNRLSFDCYIVPQRESELDAILSKVGVIVGQQPEVLKSRYQKNRMGRYRAVKIASDIGRRKAIELEEMSEDLKGVFIKTRPVRIYPYGADAAHVTGYVGAIGPDEYRSTKGLGYKKTDRMGRAGIESFYDSYLRGEHGAVRFEVDSKGRLMRVLDIREREQGKPLQLTVDADIQTAASQAMGGNQGAMVVMDVEDGGIIAMVSKPDYDPNMFIDSSKSQGGIRGILSDPGRPLINRALSGEFPPGSTFKALTGFAGLKSGKVDLSSRFFCPGSFSLNGFVFGCWYKKGHGSQNIVEALQHSCNVYFYQMGILTGINRLAKEVRKFGLGKVTGIDIYGEKSGLIPDHSWKKRVLKEKWYAGETANMVIGQGYVLATPLQMAGATAAIANGGRVYKPYVVQRIDSIVTQPQETDRVGIPAEHLRIIHQGMNRVINSDSGTGRRAQSDMVEIAGKTGTAQAPRGEDHAWFIGFAPADEPKVAIAVVMEHGGKGGAVAAPAAKMVFEKLSESGYFK